MQLERYLNGYLGYEIPGRSFYFQRKSATANADTAQAEAFAMYPALVEEVAAWLALSTNRGEVSSDWAPLVDFYRAQADDPGVMRRAVDFERDARPRKTLAACLAAAASGNPPAYAGKKNVLVASPASTGNALRKQAEAETAAAANESAALALPPALQMQTTGPSVVLTPREALGVYAAYVKGGSPMRDTVAAAAAFREKQHRLTGANLETALWDYVDRTLQKDPAYLADARVWLKENPAYDNRAKVPARAGISSGLIALSGWSKSFLKIAIGIALVLLMLHLFKK